MVFLQKYVPTCESTKAIWHQLCDRESDLRHRIAKNGKIALKESGYALAGGTFGAFYLTEYLIAIGLTLGPAMTAAAIVGIALEILLRKVIVPYIFSDPQSHKGQKAAHSDSRFRYNEADREMVTIIINELLETEMGMIILELWTNEKLGAGKNKTVEELQEKLIKLLKGGTCKGQSAALISLMVNHAELSSPDLLNKLTKRQVYYYTLRHFFLKLVEGIANGPRTSMALALAHSMKDEASQKYFSTVTSARANLLNWTMLEFLPLDFMRSDREKGLFQMDYVPSLKGFCELASHEIDRIDQESEGKKLSIFGHCIWKPDDENGHAIFYQVGPQFRMYDPNFIVNDAFHIYEGFTEFPNQESLFEGIHDCLARYNKQKEGKTEIFFYTLTDEVLSTLPEEARVFEE